MSPSQPLKLAVFISGRGSNMEALIKACADESFPAEIVLVLSSNPAAAGLEIAKNAGFETTAISQIDFPNRTDFEQAILNELNNYDIDLICLAGFMRVLSSHFIDGCSIPMINIHPSLLPKYKGLDAQRQAIEDGAQESGCSVHFVVPEVDAGEIIVQRRVPVLQEDTPDTLAARILEQEHIAYPEAVFKIATGEVILLQNRG